MTAPRPITHQRLAAVLQRHGISPTEALLADITEACKRASSAPRAVQIYQEYAEATPPKAFWESMEANVKDLVLWEQVVSAYVGLGWSRLNLSNMFEFYQRGEVPSVRGQSNGQHRQSSASHQPGNEVSAEGLAVARYLAAQD